MSQVHACISSEFKLMSHLACTALILFCEFFVLFFFVCVRVLCMSAVNKLTTDLPANRRTTQSRVQDVFIQTNGG